MDRRDVVIAAGASSSGQGTVELVVAVVFGVACVACLVAGGVLARRDSGRPRIWFAAAAAAFVVGALSLALL